MAHERLIHTDLRSRALIDFNQTYRPHRAGQKFDGRDLVDLANRNEAFRPQLNHFAQIVAAASRGQVELPVDTRNQVLMAFAKDIRGFRQGNWPVLFFTEVLLGISELDYEKAREERCVDAEDLVDRHKADLLRVFGIDTSLGQGRKQIHREELLHKILDGSLITVYPIELDPKVDISP